MTDIVVDIKIKIKQIIIRGCNAIFETVWPKKEKQKDFFSFATF